MGKRSRNNTRRREARHNLSAPSRYTRSILTPQNARRAFVSGFLGDTPRNHTNSRWEPSSRLSSYFKEVAKTRPALSQQVNRLPSTKSKPYNRPNWSSVDQKKIEQPSRAVENRPLCALRAERREIMFATGNAGRTGQKTPVWTSLSKRKCR